MSSRDAEHLKQYRFKKGQSGNPEGINSGGLPKAYEKQLRQINPETGRSYAEDIAETVVLAAVSGDTWGIMLALANDTQKQIERAVEELALKSGGTKKQARHAVRLFCPVVE